MSTAIRTSLSLLCGLAALAACSGDADSPLPTANGEPSRDPSADPSPVVSGDPAAPDGPLVSEDIEQTVTRLRQQLEPTDASSTSDSASYLTLRRDGRRCAAPLCGGFFVSRVNRLTTVCADGSRASECYVSDLDLSALGLSDEQVALVRDTPEDFVLRGEIVPESTDVGELGRLSVSEAWQGHADVAASGAFLRVTNSGIVCITTPCGSLSAELLNSRLPTVSVAEIDLEGISADPTDGLEQVNEPEGLLVAAWPSIVSGPAGRALGLDASEYFIPLTAAPSVCGTRGAPVCAEGSFCDFPPESICGRADGPGSCQPQPEVCPEIFAPVCGCDGATYDNACFANAAGVSVETQGECAPSEPGEPGEPSACGSRGLPECAEGSFCSFPEGANCGRADAPGVCQPKPEVCNFIFAPVCGCDGQTYGNACTAEAAGVSVEFEGACEDAQP
ncbi:MAG TPA: Kazal-type serine protease inhibitor family protein [Polyangiaceae bacterium]|nr:Kazal-type serine protease inhibitor family protein [Polyangiaceae bacterium]